MGETPRANRWKSLEDPDHWDEMPRFTPGPWKANRWKSLEDPDHWDILEGWVSSESNARPLADYITHEANAYLIAAAPDLYEALITLLRWSLHHAAYATAEEDQAMAALAKARGESAGPKP